MAKLYELTDAYLRIYESIVGDEPLPESVADELARIESQIYDKLESCARLIKNLSAEAEAVEAEKRRLAARASRLSEQIDWIKNYVREQMENLGETSLKAGIFSFSIRTNSVPTVSVENETAIPQDYWRNNPSLDKERIINEFRKGGQTPPGVSIKYGTHLRIT